MRQEYLDEVYYRDGRTSETEHLKTPTYLSLEWAAEQTERLHVGAILASVSNSYLPHDARPLTAALLLIVAGAVKFGWELRALFAVPYDYHLLAWLIPLACFFVAWGNRRSE